MIGVIVYEQENSKLSVKNNSVEFSTTGDCLMQILDCPIEAVQVTLANLARLRKGPVLICPGFSDEQIENAKKIMREPPELA